MMYKNSLNMAIDGERCFLDPDSVVAALTN